MTISNDSAGLMGLLPARYSKFITALIGLFITYVSIYGWTWHLDPALIMIGTALGVYGVPNGRPPAIAVPVPVSETVSSTVIEDTAAGAVEISKRPVETVQLPEPSPPKK